MAGSWDVGPGSGDDSWDSPTPHPSQQSPFQQAPVTGAPGAGGAQVSHPPVLWLVAGLAAAVVGLLLPLVDTTLSVAAVGWALGGLVAIGLLGVFMSRDLQRRSRGMAADSGLADGLRRLLVVVAVAAVAVNAWFIADAIARGNW